MSTTNEVIHAFTVTGTLFSLMLCLVLAYEVSGLKWEVLNLKTAADIHIVK